MTNNAQIQLTHFISLFFFITPSYSNCNAYKTIFIKNKTPSIPCPKKFNRTLSFHDIEHPLICSMETFNLNVIIKCTNKPIEYLA